ncbi:MAG TPA: hypothetical protein VHL14_11915 [Steroidobacteraceae bacterium]|nr:hypothetical protein [Steroidobacteraceae bacterium]
MFRSSPTGNKIAAALLLLALNASADEASVSKPNAGMRYASINLQSDGDNNRQFTGALGLSIGEHSWLQVGTGKLHIQQQSDALDPSLISLGGGLIGERFSVALSASQRNDGDKYRQHDWSGTLDWHNSRVGIGVDALHRNMELRGAVPVTNNQGSIVSAPVYQSLNGNGIGLHGLINLTERLAMSLGGMHYSYNSITHQDSTNAPSGNNGGLLSTITNPLSTQVSGVTRETAALQHSWNAGIAYRLPKVALIAQYFNDKGIENSGTLITTELCAAFFINDHWTVSPAIGYSTKEHAGGVTFGVLTTRYGW